MLDPVISSKWYSLLASLPPLQGASGPSSSLDVSGLSSSLDISGPGSSLDVSGPRSGTMSWAGSSELDFNAVSRNMAHTPRTEPLDEHERAIPNSIVAIILEMARLIHCRQPVDIDLIKTHGTFLVTDDSLSTLTNYVRHVFSGSCISESCGPGCRLASFTWHTTSDLRRDA